MNYRFMIIRFYGLFNSIATYSIVAWRCAYKNAKEPLVDLNV